LGLRRSIAVYSVHHGTHNAAILHALLLLHLLRLRRIGINGIAETVCQVAADGRT
jgi:hypothetical protein